MSPFRIFIVIRLRRGIHLIHEIAIADAIGMFIKKDKNFRGLGNLGDLKKLPVIRIMHVDPVGTGRTCVADAGVHGIAPDAGAPSIGNLRVAEKVI